MTTIQRDIQENNRGNAGVWDLPREVHKELDVLCEHQTVGQQPKVRDVTSSELPFALNPRNLMDRAPQFEN